MIAFGNEKINQVEGIDDVAKNMKLLVEGLLWGSIRAIGYDDITECIGDNDKLFSDVSFIVDLFEKETHHDTYEGVKMLGRTVEGVVWDLRHCGGVAVSIISLGSLLNLAIGMSTPAAFGFHIGLNILINGVNIYKEIKDSVL